MIRRTLETLPRTAASFLLILAGVSLAAPAAGQPFTPGLHQEAYVKASNPDVSDWFGHRVAYADGVLVVGTYREQSGHPSDPSDNSEGGAGAAYLYTRTASGWSFEAYLKAPSPLHGDGFGHAVATDGQTVVIGAPGAGADEAGRAYVFSSGGSLLAELEPSEGGYQDNFGWSVAVVGDVIAVGAPHDDGVGDGQPTSGVVYLYSLGGAELGSFRASNTETGDLFGWTLAASEGLLVVGAPGEDGPGNSLTLSGAAYVFDLGGGELAYLRAANADSYDRFGEAVAISGTTVAVGTYWESSSATGVNGDGSSNSRRQAGAVYVFAPVSGAWVQEAYLKPSYAPGLYEHFGVSVAVTGDTVVVGATGDDSPATGVGVPVPTDSASGSDSGAAYVFQRSGGTWTEVAFLKPSNTGGQDLFGYSAAAAGDTIVLGAILEDSGSKLIDGSQGDAFPEGNASGAVYVFTGLYDR